MQFDEFNTLKFQCGLSENGFKCNICGREVSIEESVSSMGKRLICRTCLERISELLGVDEVYIIRCIQAKSEKAAPMLNREDVEKLLLVMALYFKNEEHKEEYERGDEKE